jgi:hypothetical protein
VQLFFSYLLAFLLLVQLFFSYLLASCSYLLASRTSLFLLLQLLLTTKRYLRAKRQKIIVKRQQSIAETSQIDTRNFINVNLIRKKNAFFFLTYKKYLIDIFKSDCVTLRLVLIRVRKEKYRIFFIN